MNTVNYNDAEQLFGAVGTSLKKHTAEIADIVNVYGAKNLLKSEAITKTINDVTFTVNNDDSITVNGTASQIIWYSLLSPASQKLGLEGSYIASGSPSDGSESTYYIQIVDRGTNDDTDVVIYKDTGNGVIVPFLSTHYYRIQILIRNGATVNNLTFKPMIRLASIEDDTYEPYAKTNKELTDDISSLAARIKAIEDTNHLTWG